jgi:hypothetical protein
LVAAGHEVLVVHRGETEPADFVEVQHLHAARSDPLRCARSWRSFSPAR